MSGCPFNVGDVVVCVDAISPPVNVLPGDEGLVAKGLAFLSNGRCYRIKGLSSIWPVGIHLQGDPLGHRACYNHCRFRKIDDGVSEDFRHQMRSLGKREPVSSLPATTTAASLGNGRDDLGGGVRHAAPAALSSASK